MTLLKKIATVCLATLSLASCSKEAITTSSTEITNTSRRPTLEGFDEGRPAWFDAKEVWYKWDSNIQEFVYFGDASLSETSQGLWERRCEALGDDCISETGFLTSVNAPGSTQVIIGTHNSTLNVMLTEPHLTYEAFFSTTPVTEDNLAAFDKAFNTVVFKEDAKITDSYVIETLNLPAGTIVTVPAGTYLIDHSSSDYGTLQIPIEL